MSLPDNEGRIDLKKLMKYLGDKGIDSVLLEGGAALNESALSAGIVQKVKVFLAPKIFGGEKAMTPVMGKGVEFPGQAVLMELEGISQIGQDILLEYKVGGEERCLQGS